MLTQAARAMARSTVATARTSLLSRTRATTAVAAGDHHTYNEPSSEQETSNGLGFLSTGLKRAAISMLGGVDERESEHLTELNALRSRVVALTAELTGAKARLDDAAIRLAAVNRVEANETIVVPSSTTSESSPTATHPCFGELVKDFGYKQVYAVPLTTLIDTDRFPVWEKQRAYSHARAKKIAKAMTESNSPFPGVISLFELNGEHAIIDGQHRVGALRELHKAGVWPADASILLEVHQVESRAAVDKLFVDINRAEPLSLIDLPGVATDSVRSILNQAVTELAAQYPPMFSDSRRCRVPHVNVDRMRDDIFESGIIQRHGITTADELQQWLMDVNRELHLQRQRWDNKAANPTFAKALEKATAHHFFLGLDRSWLEL
eukprot:m.13156 g.13156  ORF g.13156 m.13156 type:complete len:380 (-) comp3014_c0_seq1:271-1410(-)